jgi:RecB family exonuclease
MKLNHLSASRIKMFYKCPLEYYANYCLRVPRKDPHFLVRMGSAYHQAMEISTKARMLKNHKKIQDPYHLIDSTMKKNNGLDEHKDLFRELIDNALSWGYFDGIENIEGLEVPFSEKLPCGTKVVGFIDRLDLFEDSSADIIDLKTQKKKFTQKELESNWQADIYNWALRRLYDGVGDVDVSFWVVRHKIQRVKRSADDAKRTEERLMEVAKEIRDHENPIGCPSRLCEWCVYNDLCADVKLSKAQLWKKKMKKERG